MACEITVICNSFKLGQLSSYELKEIEEVLREAYQNEFGSAQELLIHFSDGKLTKLSDGKKQLMELDLALCYDENLPKTANAAQKMKQFGETAGGKLKEVIPERLCYGGQVSVFADTEIKNGREMPEEEHPKKPEEDLPKEKNLKKIFDKKSGTLQKEYEERSYQYCAETPKFTFAQLVLDDEVRERLEEALAVMEHRQKLFEEWNLKSIMSPSVLLNLYGDSGTGKTMAAEAIASKLKKGIIRASYADIENKYLGESAKNLKAIFLAAKREDAILFIDEADSLLSARMSNASDSSAQAANSLRSQLLISLEEFDGIVIFSTNLIENYDKAFLTRLLCVELKRPNESAREKIWRTHLFPGAEGENGPNIPLGNDIDLKELAVYDFCGRDIRNTVKSACISTVVAGRDVVTQEMLVKACERTKADLSALKSASQKKWDAKVNHLPKEEQKEAARKIVHALEDGQED